MKENKYLLPGILAVLLLVVLFFLWQSNQNLQNCKATLAKCTADLTLVAKCYNAYLSGTTPTALTGTQLQDLDVLNTGFLSADGTTPC